MKYLSKLLKFLRKLYRVPGIKQAAGKVADAYIREAVADSKNTIDDKFVAAYDAARANKNYRAVLNGKAKK